jgi:hypothetical protein
MFQQLCVGLFAFFFGLILMLAGYRLFLLLIPFWGFFAGFALGAATVTALFSDQFLGTVTGWVVGFVVGLVFAVLSYFFYILGVAVLSGSIGFALGAGLALLVFPNATILAFIVGLISAIIVAGITLGFNLQKWAIIALTAIGGASTIVGGLLILLGQLEVGELTLDAVSPAISSSFLWIAIWVTLAVTGTLIQAGITRRYDLTVPEGRRAF